MSWARPAIFVAGLIADPGERFERKYTSAGMQVDLHFIVMNRHAMTLSAGYAVGLKGGDKKDNEFMLSLKIL